MDLGISLNIHNRKPSNKIDYVGKHIKLTYTANNAYTYTHTPAFLSDLKYVSFAKHHSPSLLYGIRYTKRNINITSICEPKKNI